MKTKITFLALGIVIGVALLYLSQTAFKDSAFTPLPEPYYTILFENEHVRIVDHVLKPGEKEPIHHHPPMYVYFLEDAKLRVNILNDTVMERSFIKGQKLKTKDVVHLIENIGDTEFHSLLIELNK